MAAAGLAALSAQRHLEQARAGLVALQEQDDVEVTTLGPNLRAARSQVARAQARLSAFPVGVVAAVPVLGRSLDAERAVADAAADVLTAATTVSDQLPGLTSAGGRLDLVALQRLEVELAEPTRRARRSFDRLVAVSTGGTPPQVGAGVDQAVRALRPAVDGLEDAVAGAGLARGLLGGQQPRRLLVALGNNAELRGSGGYVASFASGLAADGRLSLGPLQDVAAVADPPGSARRVPAPPEYVADYGALAGDTTQFRSWNMSPDFADSARVGAQVAGALTGTTPDVVVLLDVPALTALARLGGGDLQVGPGRTVSPDQLQDALLVDSYAAAGADGSAQVARRAELQRAASLAVSRLLGSDVPVGDAVRVLAGLAQGRHVAVWSAQPSEQAVLERLGLAGTVRASAGQDLQHVAVNNVGANKLDLYVQRDVEHEVVVGARSAEVVQRVRLSNRAPDGLVPYVAGAERPGVVVSRVELSLPPDAAVQRIRHDGEPLSLVPVRGAQRQRLAVLVELPRGASTTLEVRYLLPLQDGALTVRALPQALAKDATLDLVVRPAAGVRVQADGQQLSPAGLHLAGPFSEAVTVSVRPVEPTWRERLGSFWREPVRIG